MSKWLTANPKLELLKKTTHQKRNVFLTLILVGAFIMLCFYTPIYLYNPESSTFYSSGLLLTIFPPIVLLLKNKKRQLAHLALIVMGIYLIYTINGSQHYLPIWSFVYIYIAMIVYGHQKGLLLAIVYYLLILLMSSSWIGHPFNNIDYLRFASEALAGVNIAYYFEYLRCKTSNQFTLPAKEPEKINTTDPLTGLFDHYHFNNFLNNEINTAKQANTLLAFAILDMDYFKSFKETYGQQAGDQVLISISILLKSKLRRASDNIFRISDKQFALLFTVKNAQEALIMVEEIRNAVEQLQIQHAKSATSHFVTISAGLEVITAEHTVDAQQAYKICSDHLLKAKHSGHNQTSIAVICKQNAGS